MSDVDRDILIACQQARARRLKEQAEQAEREAKRRDRAAARKAQRG